jgi:cytochrome c1
MIQWIRNPQSFEPASIMPNLGLSEEEATAIVSYLESLARQVTVGAGQAR